eukprot:6183047-Pleurochrysis_carterae.AAC.4
MRRLAAMAPPASALLLPLLLAQRIGVSALRTGPTRRDTLKFAAACAAPALTSPSTGLVGPASAVAPATALSATAGAATFKPPPLGLGAWAWGDSLFWGYDTSEDAALKEVFDYAVSKGVRFFDTAEVYGLGISEKLLGKFAAASPVSDEIQIATKFAALPWRTKPKDVLEAAKRSTDRLGRPIDLYQIHFPNAWANEQYWEGLGEAVNSGLVRSAGVSNYGIDAMRACRSTLSARGVPLVSNQASEAAEHIAKATTISETGLVVRNGSLDQAPTA